MVELLCQSILDQFDQDRVLMLKMRIHQQQIEVQKLSAKLEVGMDENERVNVDKNMECL